jgi:hypothetical protein
MRVTLLHIHDNMSKKFNLTIIFFLWFWCTFSGWPVRLRIFSWPPLFLLTIGKVLFRRPGCLGTCHVVTGWPRTCDPPVSASWGLGHGHVPPCLAFKKMYLDEFLHFLMFFLFTVSFLYFLFAPYPLRKWLTYWLFLFCFSFIMFWHYIIFYK